MFRKPFKPSSSTTLKSSEKRKFLKQLQDAFPHITETDWQTIVSKKADLIEMEIKAVVPEKQAEMESVNIYQQLYQTMKIFVNQETKNPIFFSVQLPTTSSSFKTYLFPTLYTTTLLPNLLPCMLCYSQTSSFILNGADLMLPGVRNLSSFSSLSSSPLQKDQLLGVSVIGNSSVPFAVGRSAEDTISLSQKKSLSGKAILISHYFGDYLWKLGNWKEAKLPDGFTPSRIYALQSASGEEEEEEQPIEPVETSTQELAQQEASSSSENQTLPKTTATETEIEGEEDNTQQDGNKEEGSEEEDDGMTPQQMDELIEACFMEAIKNRVKDSDLPVEAGSLLNIMLECRPADTKLDFKNSTYKKLGKLVSQMKKDKRIGTKENGNLLLITSINRSHPVYQKHILDFKPLVKKKDNSSQSASNSNSKTVDAKDLVEIIKLYKPISPLVVLFMNEKTEETAAQIKEQLFTKQQVKHYLTEYCTRLKLINQKNKSEFVLNDVLAHEIFGKNHSTMKEKVSVSREDLLKSVLDKMTSFYGIKKPTTNGEEEPEIIVKKGKFEGIILQQDKIMGNKNITKVFGLHYFDIPFHSDDFKSALQHKLSCSVKSRDVLDPLNSSQATDKTHLPDITVQGHLAKQLSDFLVLHCKIPPHYITTENKAKPKKK